MVDGWRQTATPFERRFSVHVRRRDGRWIFAATINSLTHAPGFLTQWMACNDGVEIERDEKGLPVHHITAHMSPRAVA